MAYDEDLATRLRAHFKRRHLTVEEKRMMGGLCFMVRAKMCVGIYRDQLMVRLDPAVSALALARPGCTPMEFTGRPMRGFVLVSPEGWTVPRDFTYWLDLAMEFNPRAKSSKKPPENAVALPRRSAPPRPTDSRRRTPGNSKSAR